MRCLLWSAGERETEDSDRMEAAYAHHPTYVCPSHTKGHPSAVYYAHPKITTAMTIRMTLATMLMLSALNEQLHPRCHERSKCFEAKDGNI